MFKRENSAYIYIYIYIYNVCIIEQKKKKQFEYLFWITFFLLPSARFDLSLMSEEKLPTMNKSIPVAEILKFWIWWILWKLFELLFLYEKKLMTKEW